MLYVKALLLVRSLFHLLKNIRIMIGAIFVRKIKKMNDSAIKNNDDRILAKYNYGETAIYIITEWDRSTTTILFVDEY